MRCLKSNEDMILALTGQFKQLSNNEVATSVKAGEIIITEKICVSFKKNNLRVAKLEFFCLLDAAMLNNY